MNEKKELICIVCPVGCRLEVDQNGDDIKVSGNQCKRGEKYAIDELTNPLRMVTSSMKVDGGDLPLVSVKTKKPIPKNLINEALKQIKNESSSAPICGGDVLIKNVAGTDVDIVATRNIHKMIKK